MFLFFWRKSPAKRPTFFVQPFFFYHKSWNVFFLKILLRSAIFVVVEIFSFFLAAKRPFFVEFWRFLHNFCRIFVEFWRFLSNFVDFLTIFDRFLTNSNQSHQKWGPKIASWRDHKTTKPASKLPFWGSKKDQTRKYNVTFGVQNQGRDPKSSGTKPALTLGEVGLDGRPAGRSVGRSDILDFGRTIYRAPLRGE